MVTRGNLKVGTEALLCAAQEQAVRTNYMKYHIDKTSESPQCRLCGKKGESVQHVISGCEKLAQKGCKRRHDNVPKEVHWLQYALGSFGLTTQAQASMYVSNLIQFIISYIISSSASASATSATGYL